MILDMLVEATVRRVERAKERLTLDQLIAKIYEDGRLKSFNTREAFAFEKALRKKPSANAEAVRQEDRKQIAFICEVKKASPSKGIIAAEFPYLTIAKEYEEAGADAISVLTEPEYFKGEDRNLSEICKAVRVPVLRKDFILEEYQVYEAKLLGADAVLLICALLDTQTLTRLIKLCDMLELSTLVETHTAEEIQAAIQAGARIIGVNNRNLQTFELDLNRSIRLRSLVPEDILFVAESGINKSEDIRLLKAAGVDAVLIGEAFMRSSNKKELLRQMREG